MTKPTCATCPYSITVDVGTRECRYDPPQLVSVEGRPALMRPHLDADNWCGKHPEMFRKAYPISEATN